MKRALIVTSATVAGLAGVLAFHTQPVNLSPAGLSGASTTPTTTPTPTTSPTTTSPPGAQGTASSSSASTTTPSTTTPSGTRIATGELVNYNYGVLSVKVTMSGNKITNVTIGQIQDGGNYRSQSIDQASIPVLESETMQVQGSNIQSVSGASFTSAGFQMSLQNALSKLGR